MADLVCIVSMLQCAQHGSADHAVSGAGPLNLKAAEVVVDLYASHCWPGKTHYGMQCFEVHYGVKGVYSYSRWG